MKLYPACRMRNNMERRLLRRIDRERNKGLVRPRQQNIVVMGKENNHAELNRLLS
jgi:hypothetical protein